MTFEQLDTFLRQPRPDELPLPLAQIHATGQALMEHHIQVRQEIVRELLPNTGLPFFINPHGRLNDMDAHGHDYYEIMYVLDGTFTHVIDGRSIPMSAGSLLLMRPGVVHKVLPCTMDDIAVSITMGSHILLPRFMSTLSRLPAIGPMFRDDAPATDLYISFGLDSLAHTYGRQLLCAYFDPDSHSDITTELLLLLFLTEADRAARPEPIHSAQGIDSDIARISRYIQVHYADVTAAQVAREFGYTESYITRALKKHFGMGFVRYRNRQCLMAATALLINSRKSVSEIACEVGIPSVSHFYKLFLEEYHMTPTEYRSHYGKRSDDIPSAPTGPGLYYP